MKAMLMSPPRARAEVVRPGRKPKGADAAHFNRHQGLPGWVYVARNEMHQTDVFKVGYTTANPEVRVKGLNTEQRNRTSQIGFFDLVFKRPVINAYGAEQRLFTIIDSYRVSKGKEFFRMPLDELAAAVVAAVHETNEKTVAFQHCPACSAVVRFTPLLMVTHTCPACRSGFRCETQDHQLRLWRVGQSSADDAANAAANTRALDASFVAAVRNRTAEMATRGADEAEHAAVLFTPPARPQFHPDASVVSCARCYRLVGVQVRAGSWVQAQCDACGTHISDLAVVAKSLL